MTASTLRFQRTLFRPLSDEAKRFLRWLTVWVVLPNAPFAILWFVGGPPRTLTILYLGVVGLLVRRAPRLVQSVLWLGLFGYMCLYFVSGMFNLSIFSMAYSLQYAGELQIGASPQYVALVVAVAATVASALVLIGRDQRFTNWRLALAALIAMVGVNQVDFAMTYEARGTYKHSAPGDTPWQAGIERLDVDAAIAARRNIMVVVVESIGVPQDPRINAMLTAPFETPGIESRYEISSGSTPYFGSTTSAEMRELCGRWGEYHDLLEQPDDSCLPARLRAAGYSTTAIHSFTGEFFEREQWYPNIGFERTIFGPELLTRGAQQCSGVFAGVCDRDVVPMLSEELASHTGPQFLYFLTVNTHLPVPHNDGMDTEHCDRFDAELDSEFPMICRLMASYDGVARRLEAVLTDPDLPPMDILIVGDHMPPFYDYANRTQFSGTHVPWIVLRYRP